jgi:hypothetical protein
MDPVVSGAITAIGLDDPTQRQRWFTLLGTTYHDQSAVGEPDWTTLSAKLEESATAEGISGSAVAVFVEYLDSYASSPIGVIAELAKLGDELPNLYHQLAGQPAVDGADAGYDEAAWNSFLAEKGRHWNGEESAWEPFCEWFRYEAGQQGLGVPADQFLAYVGPQADKIAVFAQYGITIGGSPSAHPAKADDAFGWMSQPHVAELTGRWGSDWQNALRAQLDARWGDGWQQHPAEHKAAWLDGLLPELLGGAEPAAGSTETATGEPETPAASPEQVARQAIDDAIAEIPGAELLPPETVQQILAEIAAELGSQPAS